MALYVIAAMSLNRVIGKDGTLPWNCPTDMAYFKRMTQHSWVIMGRKTFESMNCKPLKSRSNIIVTKDKDFQSKHPDILVCPSLDRAVQVAEHSTAFIIGGGEIYAQALADHPVESIYLTVIHEVCDGDTFFPEVSSEQFEVAHTEDHEEEDGTVLSFVRLDRVKE